MKNLAKLFTIFITILFSNDTNSQNSSGCGSPSLYIDTVEQINTQLVQVYGKYIYVSSKDTLKVSIVLSQRNCLMACPANFTVNEDSVSWYSCTGSFSPKIELSLIPNYGKYLLTGMSEGGPYVTSFEIRPESVVGLQKTELGTTKPIYPNPFKNSFEIPINGDMEALSITILNTIGKIVYYSNNIENQLHSVDLSEMESGFYTVKTEYNHEVNVQRIIKQ